MKKVAFLLPLLCTLIQTRAALAMSTDRPWEVFVEQARAEALYDAPTWLRLLHFDSSTNVSKIVSKEFFLDPTGRVSPERELYATIRAYFFPVGRDQNLHPCCRFPARYFWLSQRLNFAAMHVPDLRCSRLEEWAKFSELQSVSLIMVSGYFGNPASSFGHALLKLNNSHDPSRSELLSISINYGALVPENELAPVYVARGLFGGYQAGFSDKPYYTQDRVYSRTEFRDMWEYELNLTDDQVRFLVYHLWEIVGKKFTYYFIKENCAYRFAELIELITGDDILSDVYVWYVPVELFHSLRNADSSVTAPLLGPARFIPSSQRVLYAQFDRLSEPEAAAVNSFIQHPDNIDAAHFFAYSSDQELAVLDTLLAYYEYRLAAVKDPHESVHRVAKDAVLRRRLSLPPVAVRDVPEVAELKAPSAGSKPATLAIGGGYNDTLDTYAIFNFTAFDYGVVGNNNLNGSELVVFDLEAGFNDKHGLFLDHLDFVRARETNLNSSGIVGENENSWQVGLGLRRQSSQCIDCIEALATGGIGRASRLGGRIFGYAMMDGVLQSRGDTFEAHPNLGLILKTSDRWSAWLQSGYAYSPADGHGHVTYRVEGRYSLTVNHDIRFRYEDSDARTLLLSFELHV